MDWIKEEQIFYSHKIHEYHGFGQRKKDVSTVIKYKNLGNNDD